MQSNNKYKAATEILLGGIFAVSVGVSAGVIEASIFGISLSEVLFTAVGFTIDWASLISVVALLVAYLTTLPYFDQMDTTRRLMILITALLVVAGMWAPGFATGQEILGLFAIGISAGGFWALNTPTE